MLQQLPTTASPPVGWSAVVMFLVSSATVLVKWLVPAISKMRNGNGYEAEFRELRGILGQMNETLSRIEGLLSRVR